MKIIGWKQLKELQPYSRQHIARLEKAGEWPLRVQLGRNRVEITKATVEKRTRTTEDDPSKPGTF